MYVTEINEFSNPPSSDQTNPPPDKIQTCFDFSAFKIKNRGDWNLKLEKYFPSRMGEILYLRLISYLVVFENSFTVIHSFC